MATQQPTKAEFVEALRQEGIHNLEDLWDAIFPETETSGYLSMQMPDDCSEPDPLPHPHRKFPLPSGERSWREILRRAL